MIMPCMRPILVTCLLLVLSEVAALGKTVRVFAVGSKLEIRYADTYQDFHDKMFALFDARHPRRAELVQAGADDVASHIQPVDPAAPDVALVNFPEDIGLAVGLIGSRGAGARRFTASHGGSQLAFANLMLKYQPQSVYYARLYPNLPSVRYLLLGETDTFYRGFYETFRDLARAYGVYLTATVNVAPARRVESAQNPALVALLRDPDEAQVRDYAYVALSPNVVNTTFIFDPDGNVLLAAPDGHVMRSPADTGGVLRGSLNKAYLTEAEESILPIAFGKVQDLDVIETPAGRLGVVISKDAWMIDVNDRYDAKGANVILQPEAYSEWAYAADPTSSMPAATTVAATSRPIGRSTLQRRTSMSIAARAAIDGTHAWWRMAATCSSSGRTTASATTIFSSCVAAMGARPSTATNASTIPVAG
jgi:hypothetical protein